jgi:tetratricopeptide (TPR) repeat protein
VEWLIWIRNWNFHWQDQYRFATPVFLPRGTVVTMRYTYDNSAGNRRNPQQPPKRVVYGGQSSDEMGDLWLRLLPKDPADAATLARSYRDAERRRDIALAEQRIATEGHNPRWRNLLGARLLEAGRIDEAIVHLEEAVRLAPHQAEGHNNLGHALQLQGRVAEAVPHFRRAVEVAPASDLVHLNLGNALDAAGEIDEAIRHFREAIALNPGAAEAHNNLGVALGSQGMLDEAAAHFRRALEIRPDYADPQKNLELVIELQKAPAPPR